MSLFSTTWLRNTRNQKWYLLILALISGVILSSLSLVIINVINRDSKVVTSIESVRDFNRIANEKSSLAFDYSLNTNSGSANDTFLCGSGSIINIAGSPPVCTGEFVPGSDGIDDACDDNNYKPTFYSDAGSAKRFLTPESNQYDDDADARLYTIGIVYPRETQTVFAMNDTMRNMILKNTNNTVYPRPLESGSAILRLQLKTASGSAIGSLSTYSIDRSTFSEKKIARILSKKTANFVATTTPGIGRLDSDGSLDGAVPYSLSLKDTDYAINITNTSDTILTYRIYASTGNTPIYTVPLNNATNPMQYIAAQYIENGPEMLYNEKIIAQVNPKSGITAVNELVVAPTASNNCGSEVHTSTNASYSVPAMAHGVVKFVTATGATTNGVQTFSLQASCSNGTIGYANETISVACAGGYVESAGYTCMNPQSCTGTISDPNASSTATSTSNTAWKYASRPGICTWNCNYGYTYNSTSKSCKLVPPANVVTASATQISYSGATWNWSAVATATFYEASTNTTNWTSLGNNLLWSETGLTCETWYTRYVRACTGDSCGNASPMAATAGVCGENGPCTGLPARSAFYNGTSSYSLAVAPLGTTKDALIAGYQASPTPNTCQWKCGTNYTWNGTACVGATRSNTCSGSLPVNTVAITPTTYTQTWNDTIWTPTISWSYGNSTCGYGCAISYVWNGSTCIYNQVNPTNMTLSHSTNTKTFTVGWTAGIGNNTCKLQFSNGGTWTDIASALNLNCDSTTNTTITLNDDGWKSNWGGTQIRLVRTGDGASVGTFPQTLSCTVTSGNTSSTPNYDENCNGVWNESSTANVSYDCSYNSCSSYWTNCGGQSVNIFNGTYTLCGTCNGYGGAWLCTPSGGTRSACVSSSSCSIADYLSTTGELWALWYWSLDSCSPNYTVAYAPEYICQQTSCTYVSQTCSGPVTTYY